ncbi:hypothetical protein MTR67_035015 [Solanum verrucosum]|uniref:Uncharacterized protein n=1 Tax=Solanum verrucosum TaxID=315347 RepID=A0AAF0ZL32_SOLVR|nr:hypothetical protein MTR67_035015 [Solanum verrucosum]
MGGDVDLFLDGLKLVKQG